MRLLIAEDDKALGLFLTRGLEADGHRVHVACDGAAGREAAALGAGAEASGGGTAQPATNNAATMRM